MQRRRGQAGGVALRAQHHPFHVVADGLRQSRVAGRVAAPLQHVAFDHQRGGHVSLAVALGLRAGCRPAPRRAAARRARRRRAAGAAGPGRRRAPRRCGWSSDHYPSGCIGEFGAVAAQRVPARSPRSTTSPSAAASRRARSASVRRVPVRRRPHHVVHPAQREGGLVAGVEPAAAQRLTVPPEFVERAGHHRQRAQRAAVVVQFGRSGPAPS